MCVWHHVENDLFSDKIGLFTYWPHSFILASFFLIEAMVVSGNFISLAISACFIPSFSFESTSSFMAILIRLFLFTFLSL